MPTVTEEPLEEGAGLMAPGAEEGTEEGPEEELPEFPDEASPGDPLIGGKA